MLQSLLERLCNADAFWYVEGHCPRRILSVTGSNSGVQIVEQEGNKTETAHLLLQKRDYPWSPQVDFTGCFSGGIH